MSVSRHLLILFTLLAGIDGAAAVHAFADDDDTPGAASGVTFEIDSENIFGFTEGSDTNDKGERELELDLVGALGRQAGDPGSAHYRAWEAEIEYQYGVTRNLTVSLGASFTRFDVSNIADLDDVDRTAFNGVGGEIKYRFLSWEHAPVGFAVSVAPEWSRFEDDSGERADGFELPVKLMLDSELVSETLFAAVNLTYAPEWTDGEEGTERESALELSGALSWQCRPGIFLGGELRYLAGYDGLALEHFQGGAFYIGPSLYAQISKSAYVKAAYSYQVAGSAPEALDSLDLIGHDRQQLKLNLGIEF
ncbi:hypothetical protein [Ancylobacter terrae]|uniref:hypothetical protein n=1 Tax=Ancylobacter sp. sgz301288 TaxID=3342077 RepID=UPI00385FB2FD